MEPVPGNDSPSAGSTDTNSNMNLEPQHCVLLRAGGQMSVLDMAQGTALALRKKAVRREASGTT